MNGMLLALDPALSERLRREPGLVEQISTSQALQAFGDFGGAREMALGLDAALRDALPGCLWRWWPKWVRQRIAARLTRNVPAPAPLPPERSPPPEVEGLGERLSLHKDWHVVHFLLTGTAWDVGAGAGRAILGGEELGDDLGYGPARLLTPDVVADVARELQATGVSAYLRRYDAAALSAADVYSADGVEEEEARYQLEKLVDFYARCAAHNRAVLSWLS